MINKVVSCIFLFVLSFSSLRGVIFEVSDLSKFEEEVGKVDRKAFVLFDIDYTLLTPKDMSLKPCGKGLRRKYLHVLDSERREWLQSLTALEGEEELMDGKFPALIQRIQHAKILVIGFTALETGKYGKITNLEDWRLNQLQKFGIDFTPAFHDKTIILNECIPHHGNYPLFKKGVLFTNRRPKGEVLSAFFGKIGWKPNKILLMDDTLDQLKSVETVAIALGIEFVGFYYTAAETNACKFDQELGEFQFQNLVENGQWLNDPEAKEKLKHRACK